MLYPHSLLAGPSTSLIGFQIGVFDLTQSSCISSDEQVEVRA